MIDITLEPSNGGTTVTLEQSNLEGGVTDSDRENREHFEQTWRPMLEGLKTVTER